MKFKKYLKTLTLFEAVLRRFKRLLFFAYLYTTLLWKFKFRQKKAILERFFFLHTAKTEKAIISLIHALISMIFSHGSVYLADNCCIFGLFHDFDCVDCDLIGLRLDCLYRCWISDVIGYLIRWLFHLIRWFNVWIIWFVWYIWWFSFDLRFINCKSDALIRIIRSLGWYLIWLSMQLHRFGFIWYGCNWIGCLCN